MDILMKKQMRRADRRLSDEEAKQLLKTAEYGILSTVSEDNVPYGVPISFAYTDGVIYMHGTAEDGHKMSNILYQSKVCFTVVGSTKVLPDKFSTKYLSAIVFGTVEIVEDTDEKKKGLMSLINKYSSNFIEKGIEYIDSAVDKTAVLKINIKYITGKGRK